jgi:hypothetical protein
VASADPGADRARLTAHCETGLGACTRYQAGQKEVSDKRQSWAELFDDLVGSIEQHLLDVRTDPVDLLAAA